MHLLIAILVMPASAAHDRLTVARTVAGVLLDPTALQVRRRATKEVYPLLG